MIKSLKINDAKNCPLPWISKVFSNDMKFEFKKGLNILFGPSGSGKSALLSLIATYFHCKQGGIQKLTIKSLNEFKNVDIALSAVTIEHNSNPVLYFASHETPGLNYGTFDHDFFTAGVRNTLVKCSSGQKTLNKFVHLFDSKSNENNNFDIKHKNADKVKHFLFNSTLEDDVEHVPTILFDEPELSLDPLLQKSMWDNQILNQKFQIIVASHSYFAVKAFMKDDVNVIHMGNDDTYLQRVKNCYNL